MTNKRLLNLGVIVKYPPPNFKHTRNSGITSYTKNLITSMDEYCKIEVFADKIKGLDSIYLDENIKVNRCWDMGLKYPYQIIKNIIKENKKFDVVHIQHEFFSYGGIFSASIFPILLIFLRLLGIHTIVTMHHVASLSILDKEFIKKNGIKGKKTILKIGFFIIVYLIIRIPNRIIVHESIFKNILIKDYKCNSDKIFVIPHGIEEKKCLIEKIDAARRLRLELNEKKVVLYFGFLTGYKGIETLIDAFKFLNDEYVLVIAGGEPYRLKDDLSHKKFISELKERAFTISKNIIFTGFVEEDNIPLYFSIADVTIFPYITRISSSGPMALSIAYERPFLASEVFRPSILLDDMIFDNDSRDIAKKIEKFFDNKELRIQIKNYIKKSKLEQNWKNIAKMTLYIYLQK